MGDYYLMVCKSCKKTSWCANDELPEYIDDHQGHAFTILTPVTRDNDPDFVSWLHKLMGWTKEAEGH